MAPVDTLVLPQIATETPSMTWEDLVNSVVVLDDPADAPAPQYDDQVEPPTAV